MLLHGGILDKSQTLVAAFEALVVAFGVEEREDDRLVDVELLNGGELQRGEGVGNLGGELVVVVVDGGHHHGDDERGGIGVVGEVQVAV